MTVVDFESFFSQLFEEIKSDAKAEVALRVSQFGLLGNFREIVQERVFTSALRDRFRGLVGVVYRKLGVNPSRFADSHVMALEAHGAEFVHRVNNAIEDLARRVSSLSELQDGIDAIPDLAPYRAELWAEVEYHSIEQQAEAVKQAISGKKFKIWVTMQDDRVRDHHVEMDGVKVPVDALFQTADGAAYAPGDPSLSPPGRINCRCVLRFED